MKQAIIVALLCLAIGGLLGFLGLSIRGIMAEKAQIEKPAYIDPKPSPFLFGGPPGGNDPPFFDPFTQSPTLAIPPPLPPPTGNEPPNIYCPDGSRCRMRQTIRI